MLEVLGVTAGLDGGMCDAQDAAALFPKFPESSDEGRSWNPVTHTGTAAALTGLTP